MATKIVQAFVGMVLTPRLYNIVSIADEELSLLVMDADAAFFRQATHADIVGMQCARIRNITVVLLCCSFGWKRSAEVLSHITAGVQAAHQSDLSSASLLS